MAEALLRARLLNGPELDAHLSKVLQLGRSSTQTLEFAVHLVSSHINLHRSMYWSSEGVTLPVACTAQLGLHLIIEKSGKMREFLLGGEI